MALELARGPTRDCACRDSGAPYQGADGSSDVDGVVAVGHFGGWVILVTRASVQDAEADVQDVLLKLSPERLLLEARATPTLQTLSRPSPSQSLVLCRGVCLPPAHPSTPLQGHNRAHPSLKNPLSKSHCEPEAQP